MAERLIELGLAEGNLTSGLSSLFARLLEIVSNDAIESGTLRTAEFRTSLESYRRRIMEASSNDADFARIGRECLSLCQEYFKRARGYLLEREAEFASIVEILGEAIGTLAGESVSFTGSLLSTSDRLNQLVRIEDIRELKRQVTQEVHELKRVVEEKRKRDEANYARLSRRIEILRTNLDRTREEASLDPLTRVANRGSFDRVLPRWVAVHNDRDKPFLIAMLDIDNFKHINDTHGHQIGDRVLLCAAQRFSKSVRSSDFLARFGGEEFAILLSGVDLTQGKSKFADLLAKIATSSYEYTQDGKICELRFTVSCGVAEFVPGENVEDVIRRADQALYKAKSRGKNRVVVSGKGTIDCGKVSSLLCLFAVRPPAFARGTLAASRQVFRFPGMMPLFVLSEPRHDTLDKNRLKLSCGSGIWLALVTSLKLPSLSCWEILEKS
jgi:diguanylate cyclase